RFHHLAVRLRKQGVAEFKDVLQRAWGRKDSRICRNPNNRGQRGRRYPEAGVTLDNLSEPRSANLVLRQIRSKCVDEDVYVRQDHLKFFRRLAYSKSSIS